MCFISASSNARHSRKSVDKQVKSKRAHVVESLYKQCAEKATQYGVLCEESIEHSFEKEFYKGVNEPRSPFSFESPPQDSSFEMPFIKGIRRFPAGELFNIQTTTGDYNEC